MAEPSLIVSPMSNQTRWIGARGFGAAGRGGEGLIQSDKADPGGYREVAWGGDTGQRPLHLNLLITLEKEEDVKLKKKITT